MNGIKSAFSAGHSLREPPPVTLYSISRLRQLPAHRVRLLVDAIFCEIQRK
jgi:hypothetical protein